LVHLENFRRDRAGLVVVEHHQLIQAWLTLSELPDMPGPMPVGTQILKCLFERLKYCTRVANTNSICSSYRVKTRRLINRWRHGSLRETAKMLPPRQLPGTNPAARLYYSEFICSSSAKGSQLLSKFFLNHKSHFTGTPTTDVQSSSNHIHLISTTNCPS
jgi:hypothetical protein